MTQTFLDKVCGGTAPEDMRAFYDAWSPTYDAELARNGYATPARAAKALAVHMPDINAPILDFGCGTGLAGVALRAAGFGVVDGCDISPGMLSQAREKSLYRNLDLITSQEELAFARGAYRAITAIGVLGEDNVPINLLDKLMEKLKKGDKLMFSLNDLTRKKRGAMARIHEHVDTGNARLLHAKHGAHLPATGLKSTVYILEKT